jgi:ABC-type multidrug transport system fused ATPase/permease subunit
LRSYEGFLDGIEADIERYQASPPELNGAKVPERCDIKFDGVSLAYEAGTDVLRNISFYIPNGNILGVV